MPKKSRKTRPDTSGRPTPIFVENNAVAHELGNLVPPHPSQGELFHVEKQVEINGIEMGVLENGLPYLTESGLSRMCGIDRKVLNRLASDWTRQRALPRGRKIAELLEDIGFDGNTLFLRSENNGTPINAYSEPVCLALLEYYAFVADEPREQARRAFRALARTTFRKFVYDAVGYSPEQRAIDSWRHFHDRIDMTLDAVPDGYFSVFREIASMIVPMIRANIIISDKVVPDISVGRAWSQFWKEKGLKKYGDRIKYNHAYPLYYPQAMSNPQPAFAYPEAVLPIFRAWLRREYITSKLPKYLTGQVRKGSLPQVTATKVIESFAPSAKALETNRGKNNDR